jgi:hypothetical protein
LAKFSFLFPTIQGLTSVLAITWNLGNIRTLEINKIEFEEVLIDYSLYFFFLLGTYYFIDDAIRETSVIVGST